MAETAHEIITNARAALERQQAAARGVAAAPAPRRSRARAMGRRIRQIVLADFAILIATFVTGLVLPIGTVGVMIAVLLMLLVSIAILFWPAREVPVPQAGELPRAPVAALPAKTSGWLAAQRPMLPAPAQTLSDSIGVRLDTLGAQLARLDDAEPAAHELRRLLAEDLPGLVSTYAKVPPSMRASDLDGFTPDRQLTDGLKVVDAELARMSEQLARGDVEALATQGKYLEYKYQGDPA